MPTTISNAISLGKSNQRLNYATQFFRFRQGRLDDFMTNQRTCHVTEHSRRWLLLRFS